MSEEWKEWAAGIAYVAIIMLVGYALTGGRTHDQYSWDNPIYDNFGEHFDE